MSFRLLKRKEIDKLKVGLEEVQKERPAELPIATKTMYISAFNTDTKDNLNICLPNFSVSWEVDKETGVLELKKIADEKQAYFRPGHKYNVVIMSTNDPTTKNACGLVSLGYYRFRWDFKNCVCIDTNPLKFRGWARAFSPQMLLPMREMI